MCHLIGLVAFGPPEDASTLSASTSRKSDPSRWLFAPTPANGVAVAAVEPEGRAPSRCSNKRTSNRSQHVAGKRDDRASMAPLRLGPNFGSCTPERRRCPVQAGPTSVRLILVSLISAKRVRLVATCRATTPCWQACRRSSSVAGFSRRKSDRRAGSEGPSHKDYVIRNVICSEP